MSTRARLSTDQRREAILKAVRKVFADKGLHGTTTKELAAAAGISEALLFKHFPNKDAIYAAMQCDCGNEQMAGEAQRIMALEPSTSTLVIMVHFLVSKMVSWSQRVDSAQACLSRLILQSAMEDGELARNFVKRIESGWLVKVEQCVKASAAAGDLANGPVPIRLRGWFAHHVAMQIMINFISKRPVVNYGVAREKLVEHAVRFVLRGMGMKDSAIELHYNPKALSLFID